MDRPKIKTIAFDADDTLWENEPLFVDTQSKCEELIRSYGDAEDLHDKLYEVEMRNLRLFGYGVKGFTLSMIETAIEMTQGRITADDIHKIVQLGKQMLDHPIELLPHVRETLISLKLSCELMIITKGDLFDQESKIARSGLSEWFDRVEIVSEKDPETYSKVLKRHGITPSSFLMVGNSLKSDVLPICEIGGHAVHVPFRTTWVHEQIHSIDHPDGYGVVDDLGELTGYVENHFELVPNGRN
ncbi:HAD family hydrolase [Pontibacter sp. G13]|uniref:HAD family hydrolase n=1 Tax=Pontibacter sp. G13 TaxID=3074898 RepID=UPI00288A5FD1|nr:HAD family hydrolase [Pontibacter sp. G13]WNJ18766.1 HAD family hydrolase [Pontibacter sp. G13]